MMPKKLQFKRLPDYEERAKLLGQKLEEHEGYFRDNDGSWIIQDENGNRVAAVNIRVKAKRGQAWNTPDPEGQAIAGRIVECWNKQ